MQNSIRNVKNYAERTIASYPRDAQDPSVFRDYKAELQRLIRVRRTSNLKFKIFELILVFFFEMNRLWKMFKWKLH